MTFDSTDIFKMGITAAVTALICWFVLRPAIPLIPQPVTPRSERITWETARQLRSTYINNNPIKTTYQIPGGPMVTENLIGFRMDAAAINEIMNNNKNGRDGSKIADELMIYFGKEPVDGRLEFRIIAAGIQKGIILKSTSTNVLNSTVFDRADPCPPCIVNDN